MYQIKAQCGYEIQVIGKGEQGLCRVVKDDRECYRGTYAECARWLKQRAVGILG
jgi:hypothetical protein